MGAESCQELARELELLRSQASGEVVRLKSDLNVRRRVRLSYQAHQGIFFLGAILVGFALGMAGTAFTRRNSRKANGSFWSAPGPLPPPRAAKSRSGWALVLPALHFLSGVGRPLMMAWAKGALRQGPVRAPRRDGVEARERDFAQTS